MTVASVPGPDRAAPGDTPLPDDWAVCCSGGGIRSAAYCLGALQSLDQTGLIAKTRWILGVSGGSYIASSRALVAADLPAGAEPHAYAPGTPEERNLRYDSRYIAPNGSTVLVGVLSLFLGAIGTLVIALAPLYVLTHAWGWLLRWQDVLTPTGARTMSAQVTSLGWWLTPVIAAGVTLVCFFYWWCTLEPGGRRLGGLLWLKPDDRDHGTDRAFLVSWAATLAVGLALAMLAVSPLISWLTHITGSPGTIAHFLGFGARPSWSLGALAGLIAAVTAVARYCQTGLAKWTAWTSAANAKSTAAAPGLLTRLTGRIRQFLLPWVASAAIVLVGAVLALRWVSDGARAGFSAGQLLPVGVALGVTLLVRAAVNVNRLSMHDFYRWRLADAFAVTRRAAEADSKAGGRVLARQLFAKATATRLSELPHGRDQAGEPGLVVCGTANINAVREVPPGRGGFCVTFDPEHVTLHREKGLAAAERAEARTSDYEALVGHRRSTLFDVSAISGAAVSPLMGAATRHAYRLLFTATNVRLGVWLPHPNVVRDARKCVEGRAGADSWWVRHPLLLLLWYLSPHLIRDRHATRSAEREARLWAHVLTLRLDARRRKQWSGALWYRTMQPTLGLLWAEAAGRLSYRATWMYVTDGGHYDNLGLVEALRRGARHIVVLDASGDKADTWFTLGGAIALARVDAGVDIDLDPTTMVRGGHGLAPGQVVRPWAHGWFHRPPAESGPGQAEQLPQQGEIWVCKLGWWPGAPWDVQAYARQHPTYPCDSTLEQLYDATEFEAYQQLGVATVLDATERCRPPLKWVAPPAPPSPAGAPPAPGGSAGNGQTHPAEAERREPVHSSGRTR
jgi:hypothetical protein